MTAEVIYPLAAWLTTLDKKGWETIRGKVHHDYMGLRVGSFVLYPLSTIEARMKLRPLLDKQILWKDYVDKKHDLNGYRVRLDIVAGVQFDNDPDVIMFVAAETPSGVFVETYEDALQTINDMSFKRWCFHNKAFFFEDENDALLVNAYVFS